MTQLPTSGDHKSQNQAHLLQLAQDGDVTAIATLINRHLTRHHMTAQVNREGEQYHVVIAAAHTPVAESLVPAVGRMLLKLQVPAFRQLKVSCQQMGTTHLAWSHEQIIPSNADAVPLQRHLDQSQHQSQRLSTPPISLQQWLNQKAHASLANLIQPVPEVSDIEAEVRLLRFSLGPSNTALLPLSSIRQVVKMEPQSLLTVPDMPTCVLGICNFHGEMLWMVDLGLQLGLQGVATGRNGQQSLTDFAAVGSPSHQNWMAIVIQAQSKSMGLIIPKIIDIESHHPAQLKPPTADLFPPTLLPFIQSYLVRSSSPVLNAHTLITDQRLQVHAA